MHCYNFYLYIKLLKCLCNLEKYITSYILMVTYFAIEGCTVACGDMNVTIMKVFSEYLYPGKYIKSYILMVTYFDIEGCNMWGHGCYNYESFL